MADMMQLGPEPQAGRSSSTGARAARRLIENRYVWLAFFVSAGLMIFVWFCLGMIPFGGKTILRMDLYHQYAPLFAELLERLKAGRSLLYSWDTGLGGNFLGNFYNYLASPAGLLVLLFGHNNIPEAIGVMILLKCAVASGAFAWFLRRAFKKNDASIMAFGVLYSFCGFFIAYYWNVMWIDAMALLPIVAFGVMQIVRERRFGCYSISLALTLVCNYYMGFMVCIFSVLFFLARWFMEKEPAQGRQAQKEQARRRAASVGLFALGSLLAGALAAFALLPVFFALRSSSATGNEFPGKDALGHYFNIFDFLANHLADVTPTIRSSGDDVLPNVYCGVITLLLVPLYLLVPSKFVPSREKLAHILLLGFLFFSFNTHALNFVWHAMHFPNDLPYRFSFIYSFLLLFIAFRTLQYIRKIPLKGILGVSAFAMLFVVLAEKIGSKNLQDITVYLNLAFLAAYTLLFSAMHKSDAKKQASLALLLFCCVITEVCAADAQNFEITQQKINYTIDLADFQKVKSHIEAADKDFYRLELTDLRTRMDPAWYDYRGVSTFSSMAYQKTANLENRLGLGGNFINSYTYNPNTPVYNAMHNIKYLVENQNFQPRPESPGRGSSFLSVLNPLFYIKRSEWTRERFTVFENKYPLSLGFWVNDAVRYWETAAPDSYATPDPFDLQDRFWSLASGVEDVFMPLDMELDADYYNYSGATASKSGTYVSFNGKPAEKEVSLPFTLTTETAQNAYIFAEANYISAIKVNREGGPNDAPGTSQYRSHDEKAVWDLGMVTPEEPLSLEIMLSGEDAPESGGFNVYTYGLNLDSFLEGYETLAKSALQIKQHSDTLIQGSVAAPAKGLLYTSIPYDKGWQVSIDGKRVPVSKYVAVGDWQVTRKSFLKENFPALHQKLAARGWVPEEYHTAQGGLLAVPLEAGQHNVTLKFVPQGYRAGMLISGGALVLLALCGLLSELLRRRKAKPEPRMAEGPMFSTEGLPDGAFSLDDEDEDSLPPPFFPPLSAAPPAPEDNPPPPAAEPPPEPQPEPPPQDPPEEAAAPEPPPPSLSDKLQEIKARAEELQRKMQMGPEPHGDEPDDGQHFRLI
ncbi:MAG: YfhO family protein [Oscillospiraceae bacterium]|jgi:uncharacterized membrane protein YfhO|nr:YfhO family protein [Oscillospiraceae bacterium]